MTRKEEIEQAGKSYCKDCVALKFPSCAGNLKRTDILAAYRAGAEWADRTMIDKVCEWLEDNIYDYLYINRDFNEADFKHELIEDLRKAMEGISYD